MTSQASFTALNVEEEEFTESDEGIREVQIEEAFKLFQKALKAQYDRDYDTASSTYDELFKDDIFVTEMTGNIPPSIHRLKYLAYKNHGQLVLDWIKLHGTTDNVQLHTKLVQGVSEFAEALVHDDQDADFWLELASFLPALKMKRLTRFALESALLTKSTALDMEDKLEAKMSLGIDELSAAKSLLGVLESIGDKSTLERPVFKMVECRKVDGLLQQYMDQRTRTHEYLQPLIQNDVSSTSVPTQDQQVNLFAKASTWVSVGSTLSQLSTKSTSIATVTSEPVMVKIRLPDASKLVISELNAESEDLNEDMIIDSPASDQQETTELASKRKRKSFVEEAPGERSSKRVRGKAEESAVADDSHFFENMDYLFAQFGLSFGNVNQVVHSETDETTESRNIAMVDFILSLKGWKDTNGNIFLKGEGIQTPASNASRLLDLAMVKGSASSKPPFPSSDGLIEFVSFVNADCMYLSEVCIDFIKELLLPKEDMSEPFLQSVWPANLTKVTRRLIFLYFDLVMQVIGDAMKVEESGMAQRYARMTQSLFEMLLDDYVEYTQQHGTSEHHQTALDDYKWRLRRWKSFTIDALSQVETDKDPKFSVLQIRYEWASTIYNQVSGASHETVKTMFENFQKLMNANADIGTIELPNTPYIPEISADTVNSQLSKIQAASMFSSIFEIKGDNPDKQIKILKTVLKRSERTEESSHLDLKIVEKFIDESTLEFRLYLWELLKSAYDTAGEDTNSFDCLLVSLELTVNDLTTVEYKAKDRDRRTHTLYRSLHLSKELLSSTVSLAISHKRFIDSLTDARLSDLLCCLVSLLRILHAYVVFDDGVVDGTLTGSESEIYTETASKFQEMLVQCWTFAYMCFKAKLTLSAVEDFDRPRLLLLSLLHEELGIRQYCSAAGGIFLNLLLKELLAIKLDDIENEVLQCVHCQFGLTLGNEFFYPYDHKTTPVAFDRSNALDLLPFLMALAARRKQSTQGLSRTDMKTVLDKFCEVIGVPRRDHTGIYYNQTVIDKYLSTSISPMLLRQSLRGLESLSTIPIRSDYAEVAFMGLYCLQGQIYLAQYRSRKRTMAGRTEDLDYAIRYFKHDLVCNTNRFESWYGLAQTYDAQAEDDMTWSAEKMNSENKKGIALTQRRALLCFAVATSLYLRHEGIEPPRQGLAAFWTDFGFELYSSTRPPMSMGAYKAEDERHFSGSTGMYSKPNFSEMKTTTGIRVALNMFQTAARQDTKDWKNYYMQGKCMGKLGAEPETVLDMYLKAIESLKRERASADPIFEPHYKLLSVVYKYFQSSKLDLTRAMAYAERSQYYKRPDEPVTTSEGFYLMLIGMLTRLKAADKKHWHHRPTYRIATIYDNGLNETVKAKDEMSSFFSLKAAKNFLTIWKPEYERPGRHFVYAYQYTTYYIELLEKTDELESLIVIARKVRRLMPSMVRHTECWEFLCNSTVEVLRRLADVPERYLETSLTLVPVEEFMSRSGRLEVVCVRLKPVPKMIAYLQDAYELRKLNIGLAPTARMEEVFGSIYMKLYQGVDELEQAAPIAVTATATASTTATVEESITPTASERGTPVPGTPSTSAGAASGHGKARTARVTKKELISKANSLLKALMGDKKKDTKKKEEEGKDDGRKQEYTKKKDEDTEKKDEDTKKKDEDTKKTDEEGKDDGKKQEEV
ncbi:hypothetical protein V1512DRAFT_208858 [Lipomyces arxii]|uniref:uncharacterized protein n=1 Tax=Lipomyces arxii TaxID=56418 RepID=UPI0034CEA97B